MTKTPGILRSRILGLEPQTVFWNQAVCDLLESNWMVRTMGLSIFPAVTASCPLKGTQVHRPLTSSDDLSLGEAFWAKMPWEYGQHFHVDSSCTLLSGEALTTVCIKPTEHFVTFVRFQFLALFYAGMWILLISPPFISTK